jgi:hypothetical protein
MYILILLAILFTPSLSFAAYNSSTVISNELKEDGRTRLVFRFTGNAGEPAVVREYIVNSNSSIASLRNWVYGQITELNLMRTASTLPSLQSGQIVAPLQPVDPTPPTPTARQIWLSKVTQYKQFASMGLTGTAATDLAALLADINATYVTGYLQ